MNDKFDLNIPNEQILEMLEQALIEDVRHSRDADFDDFRIVQYGGMTSDDHVDDDDRDSELIINLGRKANVDFNFFTHIYYQGQYLGLDFLCSGVAEIMSYADASRQSLGGEDILIGSVKVALVSDVELNDVVIFPEDCDFYSNSTRPETSDMLPLIDWVFKLTKWGDLEGIENTVFDDMSPCPILPVLSAKQKYA